MPRRCFPAPPRLDALLVTEPGGHLLEMWAMRDVTAGHRRAWCTIDSADVRSLLRDERVILGHGPTCRSLGNLARNLRVAWRVLRLHRPRVVLCTGSGIVVPFAWIGRLLGARVLYVECGGRVERPSLSCRVVSPIAHRTYVQSHQLAGRVRGGAFHGRLPWERAAPAAVSPQATGRTVITVGTSVTYPFDRLVRCSEALDGSGAIVVQRGASTVQPTGAEVVDFMSFDELCMHLSGADTVLTHAGIGSVLLALMHGHHPVIMPRHPELGEGVDDHQIHFARWLEHEGLATVVEQAEDVEAALRRARDGAPDADPPRSPNRLLRRLDEDIRAVLGGPYSCVRPAEG